MKTKQDKPTRAQLRARRLLERWKNVERVLKDLSPHDREHHFHMSTWGVETSCGTIGCAAGLCSLDPWFKENGFRGSLYRKLLTINGCATWAIAPEVVKYFGRAGTVAVFLNDRLIDQEAGVDVVLRAVRRYIKALKAAA